MEASIWLRNWPTGRGFFLPPTSELIGFSLAGLWESFPFLPSFPASFRPYSIALLYCLPVRTRSFLFSGTERTNGEELASRQPTLAARRILVTDKPAQKLEGGSYVAGPVGNIRNVY